MSTLKDVARQANVSVATVSYVLNNTKTVSPEVEARVRQAAKALNYYPNRSARSLKTGNSLMLGMVVPDLQNPFFPAMVQAVERKARELGYGLVLVDAAGEGQHALDGFSQLMEQGVDAAIWIPMGDEVPQISFPTVTIDRPLEGFDAVYADHFQGGQLLALQAQRMGHQKVGMLSGPQSLVSARLRREGFMQAKGALEVVWDVEVGFDINLPKQALKKLLARKVSLVVGGNDVIAIGAMHALLEQGIGVPEEVSLMGFDDIPWASIVRPRLYTVRQPIQRLGERAVELVIRRLGNPQAPRLVEKLPVALIPGNSTVALGSTFEPMG